MAMAPKKIAFLCGSGISVPLGLPSVTELTGRILSSEGFGGHTSGNFGLQPAAAGCEDHVARICQFLNIVKHKCDEFYQPWQGYEDEYVMRFGEHETNYEDIFYIVKQIEDSEFMEHENPALEPLISELKRSVDATDILREGGGPVEGEWWFENLITKTESYMVCAAWRLLEKEPSDDERQSKLSLFREAYDDQSFVSRIHVYTLNHDVSFERLCTEQGFDFADGFSAPSGDIKFWSPIDNLEKSEARIRLLKLHGSINWFQFPDVKTSQKWNVENIGIPINGDDQHSKDANENSLRADPSRPLILMGTFNKMLTYQLGIFAHMQALFYFSLRDADHLIVCGYGFGDKGVNARILDWIWAEEGHKAIVIDPKPDKLKTAARGAFRKSWERLNEMKKVEFIRKGIEEIRWDEIKAKL